MIAFPRQVAIVLTLVLAAVHDLLANKIKQADKFLALLS